jgi:hypothetical protein
VVKDYTNDALRQMEHANEDDTCVRLPREERFCIDCGKPSRGWIGAIETDAGGVCGNCAVARCNKYAILAAGVSRAYKVREIPRFVDRCGKCKDCTSHGCTARFKHLEPPADCARDDLMRFIVERGLEPEDADWLLEWAHRRYAQLLGVAEDGLRMIWDVRTEEGLAVAVHQAKQTLRRMGVI